MQEEVIDWEKEWAEKMRDTSRITKREAAIGKQS